MTIPQKIIGLLFLFCPLILETPIHACPYALPTETVSINGHRLVVDLATTPKERSCGLSNRSELKKNHGMLFVYSKAQPLIFWMKDTRMPLSIAFLDGSGNIINIESMVPEQTEKKYRSQRPALYALEVNRGWFQSRGIEPGDTVEIHNHRDRKTNGKALADH